ncbi:MAG: alkaline phosphatase family protein [Aulosira sp. ZfuVER01]|nr:alkaline phosphatase family protein [Aulosira sp. ZfuVER01]MDZ8001194.1 alkaline phosphatase family protein [Aulosira sp. DedVER01a]MDZ8050851.1 alkaline phosphatase family protein [Aulosira sp. ZfuCHP01]
MSKNLDVVGTAHLLNLLTYTQQQQCLYSVFMLLNSSLKKIFPSVCLFGLSLSISACSFKSQEPNQPITNSKPIVAKNTELLASTPTPEDKAIPKYDHIFVIVEENKSYDQIIGNPNAPIINQLAKTYGLAKNFYGVVHLSEANYIAMLGGSTFGIHDDDAFYCQAGNSDKFCYNSRQPGYASHTITSQSLIDQLEKKGLTWKGYFEDIPFPGSKVVVAPSVKRALYAVKHNGFLNFKKVQDDPKLSSKIVEINQLTTDLKSDKVPNYSHIIFNQCHEMHGLEECPNLQNLIKTADGMIDKVVKQITTSKLWAESGNNAIIITWDEDNNPLNKTASQGCCGYEPKSQANFGGGHIATIVITNHGSRGVVDNTPYNHYSLLRTTEDAFGIYEYLNLAGDTSKGVKPMTALFTKK